MERAPLEERAIIRIAGKQAELMMSDDLSWACDDAELEDRLNEYFRQIDGGYQPDPVGFFVTETARHFDGEIVSIPPPLDYDNEPPGRVY